MSIKISFIIPTLNADSHLSKCLNSIARQKYPTSHYEVLVVDGGSTDKTVKISRSFSKKMTIRLIHNEAIDAESGKRLGIKKAKGKYIVLLDADNQIVGREWLKTGVEILDKHRKVWGVESKWLVNKQDSKLNQYFTLLAITDPVARVFSPTSRQMIVAPYQYYQLVTIGRETTPIIGANGFFYRKSLIKKEITQTKKFEEVNYVAQLISNGHQTYGVINNGGIYHYYCSTISGYIAKRRKIASKFLKRKSIRQKTWLDKVGPGKFILAVIYNFSIIGPTLEAIYQCIKSKNDAWLYHPIISWLTVVSYAYFFVKMRIFKIT